MPSLPELTVADVRAWTVDRYYERGETYFRDDRIQRPRREGRTLKARCRGSRPAPYRIEIRLDEDGIAFGSCSCPVGDDGRCKHAVALLLTWVNTPEAFTAVEPLLARLRDRSKETLLTVIERLLDHDPSLQSLVDLILRDPAPDQGEAVQAYVEQAFEAGGLTSHDYGYAREVAEHLDPLLDRGAEHLAAEEWDAARTVFRTVLVAVQAQLDHIRDEDGSLISVLSTCAEGLSEVLCHLDDPEPRSRIVEALLDLYVWNAEQGGHGAGRAAADALRAHTTEAEKRMAADALRDPLPPPPDESPESPPSESTAWTHEDWMREQLGDLLLDLERDRLSPDEYVALCRRTGHWVECADRLLAVDRIEEAAEAAAHLPDHRLRQVLDRFVEQGASDTATALAERRLDREPPSLRLCRWLYDHACSTDQYEQALDVAHRLFDEQPSVSAYDRVREAAEPLGRWDAARADLRETVQQRSRPALLVRIYLHDDEIEAALDVLDRTGDADRTPAFEPPFLATVADEVAATHPDAAAQLYQQCARQLIEERGRPNYAEAADRLRRAKEIYAANDELGDWQSVLDTLYEEELHRLPAARDEFEKADLL